MKLDSRSVRFKGIIPWFGRQNMTFVGRNNSIQLLETALVIEGNQQTLGLILVDLLFQQALSEWTTVTIPYSRIERFWYQRMWLPRLLVLSPFFFCLWFPCVASAIGFALSPTTGSIPNAGLLAAVLIFEMIGLTVFVIFMVSRFLSARHCLLFRHANGQLMLTCFAIRSRALRRAFEERLEANRIAAKGKNAITPEEAAAGVAPTLSPGEGSTSP